MSRVRARRAALIAAVALAILSPACYDPSLPCCHSFFTIGCWEGTEGERRLVLLMRGVPLNGCLRIETAAGVEFFTLVTNDTDSYTDEEAPREVELTAMRQGSPTPRTWRATLQDDDSIVVEDLANPAFRFGPLPRCPSSDTRTCTDIRP